MEVGSRDSYHSFRSQIGLSANMPCGAHKPRLQVCGEHMVRGPGRAKSKQEPCQQYQSPEAEQGLGLCEWSFEAREFR